MATCQITTPTAIVLIGATGDLARTKLLGALYDLAARDLFPAHYHIIAFSKDPHTTDSYRVFVRNILEQLRAGYDQATCERFLATCEYVRGTFDDHVSFTRIKASLEAYDTSIGMCTSKLFYLAVPPTHYDTIFTRIAAVSLEQPCVVGQGWTRILVEKPFGTNLDHARYLEERLRVLFREEQVYRIDHYLAKDALQNILAFRFSNTLFEQSWNATFIESVAIRLFETQDVSRRGEFFDSVGALRDVGQNHLLQMLALIALDRPDTLDAAGLRSARSAIMRALVIPTTQRGTIVRGQYTGYRETPHVAQDSTTETYFLLKTELDTPRWTGVPFYLEHGKALRESRVDITVRFRSSPRCVCGTNEPHNHPNIVRFTVAPTQTITVRFWVSSAHDSFALEPSDLLFDRAAHVHERGTTITDAYTAVLFDALCGDQTRFVSNDEQDAAWQYITAILDRFSALPLLPYPQGSEGPISPLKQEVCARVASYQLD